MNNETHIKGLLRDWIIKKNQKMVISDIKNSTKIMEQRIITSVQLMDLIMYLEHLMDQPVNVTQLKPGVFNSVNDIYHNFFDNTSNNVVVN